MFDMCKTINDHALELISEIRNHEKEISHFSKMASLCYTDRNKKEYNDEAEIHEKALGRKLELLKLIKSEG